MANKTLVRKLAVRYVCVVCIGSAMAKKTLVTKMGSLMGKLTVRYLCIVCISRAMANKTLVRKVCVLYWES